MKITFCYEDSGINESEELASERMFKILASSEVKGSTQSVSVHRVWELSVEDLYCQRPPVFDDNCDEALKVH